jgi:DNA-directed RNA polymerase specialized sigma24 family protein
VLSQGKDHPLGRYILGQTLDSWKTPAVAQNASAGVAFQERCPQAIRDEYGDAYILGLQRTARFLMNRGAPPGYAEELSQAAWVRGWERLHQFRGESAVSAWVNTIALNLFRGELPQVRSMQPLMETQSDFRMDIAAIDASRILSFCRPGDRALLEHQLNGVTVDELARVFGVTSTAIRIRLLRARRAVRVRLEQRAARLRGSPLLALMRADPQRSGMLDRGPRQSSKRLKADHQPSDGALGLGAL